MNLRNPISKRFFADRLVLHSISVSGRYLALEDGVPEPDTVAGVAWLYVDEADGDLKVKFGDGHVATVAGDTP